MTTKIKAAEDVLEKVPCAFCDSPTSKPIYRKFNLYISQCADCGLIYCDPRLTRENIMKRYNPDYFWNEYLPSIGVAEGNYDLEFFDRRYSALFELVSNYATPPGRLLEIGTGAGFLIKSAERIGWDVTGIEVSASGVEFARSKLGLNVKEVAAEEMVFENDYFDVVIMFEVIEHLFDPRLVLQLVYRLLRSDGLLVISTPNINALSRLGLGTGWAVLSPAEHLYYFGEDSLAMILKQAGFKDVEFVRRYAPFGLFETTNPFNTHYPKSFRAKMYGIVVNKLISRMYRFVQAKGRGDTLLCLSKADKVALYEPTPAVLGG